MSYKSATQPLCRYCGSPIRKRTETVWLCEAGDRGGKLTSAVEVKKLPQTKAEAQQITNLQIMSVRRSKNYDWATDVAIDNGIDQFTTWDGVTYVDPFFCNGTCTRDYAYSVARSSTLACPDYHKAIAKKGKDAA